MNKTMALLGAFAILGATGCTNLHPIRQDPNAENYKGASRAKAYCTDTQTDCPYNKIYRSPRDATQALHNIEVYRDFYEYLASDRRKDAARWSDLFAASTVFGVLAVAADSARGLRLGVLGAGGAEIMDSRYQFAKQADEFLLASKVFACVETHGKDALPADGVTATVSGGKVLVTRQVLLPAPGGGAGTPSSVTVQEQAPNEEKLIDVTSILRTTIGKINERLSARLTQLTPAKPSAEELRAAFVRQKDALVKSDTATAKTGNQPQAYVAAKGKSEDAAKRAVQAGVALQENIDACYAEMK